MPLIPLRPLMDYAKKHKFGIAAFNVNNMEQIQAIMEAAFEIDAPVIIQASRGARSYTNDLFLKYLMQAAVELYPTIPVVMHQDHGNSPETCISAMRNGFTSVMMDGSLYEDGKEPSTYEYNVRVTRYVVDIAHSIGVSVEGELGTLGSLEHMSAGEAEDGHGASGALTIEQLLTDPDQAVDFVSRTGVDALAVAIGTSHGAYKFTKEPTKDVLVIDRILEIHSRIPECHIVMHGSSSVPQDLLETVNRYGGKLRQAWGVPVPEIQKAIQAGVRKINVDTDGRLAATGAIRQFLHEHPEEFDPRAYLKEARSAMKRMYKQRMIDFGQSGHGSKIAQMTLETAARKYMAGDFGESAKPKMSFR
ncbi:MAG: fructose-bisphosphate aldolase class II [Chlamydia sp.]